MKRLLKLILIVIMLCGGLIAVSKLFMYVNIYSVNRGLEADGFQLLMKSEGLKEKLEKEFISLGGFGGEFYQHKKEDFSLVFSGFPDVLSKQTLTGIGFNGGEYGIYGIKIGDNYEAAIDILKEKGFKYNTNDNNYVLFRRGRVSITLERDLKGYIASVAIRLQSTNRKKVVF